jgi:hypothetical protein
LRIAERGPCAEITRGGFTCYRPLLSESARSRRKAIDGAGRLYPKRTYLCVAQVMILRVAACLVSSIDLLIKDIDTSSRACPRSHAVLLE